MLNNSETWTIFIDGAARGNPGKAGAGIHIEDENGVTIAQHGFFLGHKTNNQAEYLALALAAFFLADLPKKPQSFLFTSDSLLLVKQMQGAYKVKNPTLKSIKEIIVKTLAPYECRFKHVLREYNKVADNLANQGVDYQTPLPESLQEHVDKQLLLPIP